MTKPTRPKGLPTESSIQPPPLPPATIYLQCYDEAGDLLNLVHDDVTWCIDPINENDAVYAVIPPPSALPLEQRLWIAQQYEMNRAQYENTVRGECLEIARQALEYIKDALPGTTETAISALDDIKRRLAQLEEEPPAPDATPCGHPREAIRGDGVTHWCSQCQEEANDRGT